MLKYTQADLKRCIADHKEGKNFICMEYLPMIGKVSVSMKSDGEVKPDIYIVAPDIVTGLPHMVLFRHTQEIDRDFKIEPAAISKLVLAAMADDAVWQNAQGYSNVES